MAIALKTKTYEFHGQRSYKRKQKIMNVRKKIRIRKKELS